MIVAAVAVASMVVWDRPAAKAMAVVAVRALATVVVAMAR